MGHCRWLAVCALLCVSVGVRAQGEIRGTTEVGEGEGEETVGESKVAKIHRVERGLFFNVDWGPYFQVPVMFPQETCLTCVGTQIGVRVGYDILNNLELDLFYRGSFAEFVKAYDRVNSGDIAGYYTGLGLRFSYITTERFHATVRLGGGVSFVAPKELMAGNWIVPTADAAAGVEYFTKLRHFSVGAEISTLAYIYPFSIGFSVLPTAKYTF